MEGTQCVAASFADLIPFTAELTFLPFLNGSVDTFSHVAKHDHGWGAVL